jgi:hypothetical protein
MQVDNALQQRGNEDNLMNTAMAHFWQLHKDVQDPYNGPLLQKLQNKLKSRNYC